jgi:hypothetical protein
VWCTSMSGAWAGLHRLAALPEDGTALQLAADVPCAVPVGPCFLALLVQTCQPSALA